MIDFSNLTKEQIKALTASPYYALLGITEAMHPIEVIPLLAKCYEDTLGQYLIPNPENALWVVGDVLPCLTFDQNGYYSAELIREILKVQPDHDDQAFAPVHLLASHGLMRDRINYKAVSAIAKYEPDITTVDQVLAYGNDIYDITGRRVLKRIPRRHTFLSRTSPYSQSLYMLLASLVVRSISAHLVLGDLELSTPIPLDCEHFLTEAGRTYAGDGKGGDCDHYVAYEEAETLYHDVLVSIDNLVKPHAFKNHRLYLEGFTFRIERGIDNRILEYHRQMEEHLRSVNNEI